MDILRAGQSALANIIMQRKGELVKTLVALLTAIMSLLSAASWADDTELYVYEASARTGARPQILLIFDNSGSMGTTVYDVDVPYKPGAGGSSSVNNGQQGMLYYVKGDQGKNKLPNPDDPNERRKFSASINGCESSWELLNDYGIFTGFFRKYTFSGANGAWREFGDNNGLNAKAVDCYEDIQDGKYLNASGLIKGLPIDSQGSLTTPIIYTPASEGSDESVKERAKELSQLTGFGTGRVLTVYTEDYLRWYHSKKATKNMTRMDLAKNAIKNVILTTPGVDFGLAIFNMNGPDDTLLNGRNGGRIIKAIKTLSSAEKKTLLDGVKKIAYGWNTPLCETLYEAYLYFAGKPMLFGNQDKNYQWWYDVNDNPSFDSDALKENTNIYQSPFKKCQNNAYIVYITDGEPTLDSAADGYVKPLTQGVDKHSTSYMSALSSWMYRNDVNDKVDGDQHVITHTIGFSEGAKKAEDLLKKVASKGGGSYFDATDATKLQGSIQQAVNEVLANSASFTSPSVASNNFNRTQTFNYAYYSMFLPDRGPRWTGNIKKFRVDSEGKVLDAEGNLAIGEDGNIKDSACSYWTPKKLCGDGNDVRKGGVLSAMQSADSRTLYSNLGGGMDKLSLSAAASKAGGKKDLANFMGVDKSQLKELFDWAKGLDVDNEKNQSSIVNPAKNWRSDIMGDALHSKPLALNFGSKSSPDIRILVGTNHGFMHMFKDDTTANEVSETWAFMPYELLPNIQTLRNNVPTGVHSVYGVDGSPVAYVKNGASGIEKAWLFFGMRRGGGSYYALDISNPDSPSFKWRIDASSPGLSELGQSWSTPVVTTIRSASGTDKPVLIFGAGYSPAGKDSTSVGTKDNKGRGVFIVDADTGKLIHQFGAGGGTALPGIQDSIPSGVAVLDADGDGNTDRIYAVDTGGSVWRMDMPKADKASWSAFKFADLGGKSLLQNRRFYSAPAVAQTLINNVSVVDHTVNGKTTKVTTSQNVPYDAVVVGSGHRAAPSDTSREDILFVLQDRNVVTQTFGDTGRPKAPATLTISDLYENTESGSKITPDKLAIGKKLGWYFKFPDKGEKNLSPATIIEGEVLFTTFVPGNSKDTNQCLSSGKGYVRSFNLQYGTSTYTSTKIEAGNLILDTPQLVIPPVIKGDKGQEEGGYMYLIGIGNAAEKMKRVKPNDDCPPGDNRCVGGRRRVNKLYYYSE
ncbi:rRNA (guanine-N1)-methyltransferase [Shewanella insulae]|uniref:pilus assembly protein n=1 Tax=Shewanella insulae TaxID=2681496 RepID=UPI001EFEABFB|nr:PilC/PilY family type IV pilus protein [Shewanella insulae]MCG9711251.1 rRNA (guanine-N1)-methyltransferase [Shewanella insulae]MCG9753674.1 rRNA (guanine-N1)-methyltransferase [Shewanella insulae]